MNLRTALIVPLALVLAATVAPPAAADARVPAIANTDLPVAGTCAPIRSSDVTHVMIGERTSIRWYRVAGLAEPVELAALLATLKVRAGTARPSRHAVWITASAQHAWIHVMRVRQACFSAGIYRVGLRVRSEATGQVMGFPLFLPPGKSGTPAGKAGLLQLRINTLGEKNAKAESDVGHIYAAAKRAMEQRGTFGVDQIIGRLWLAPNTPLQYAVRSIDLLYRGGCAGVWLRSGARPPPPLKYKAIPIVEIQGGMVSRHPQSLAPPPIQPRSQPWGLAGAGRPGWVDLEVVELPTVDGKTPAASKPKPRVRPNYAAQPGGVPADVFRSADAQARIWSQRLGEDLLKGLRGDKAFKDRFVVALRRDEVLPKLVAAARGQFPDATRVIPSTLQFNVFLFNAGTLVGRADVTVSIVGDRLRIVFGSWRPLDRAMTLAPFVVDPFATGEPAAWRIWFEGVFHDARTRGRSAWPTASSELVTRYFPAVARRGVSGAIAARDPKLDTLAAELAKTPYDRLVLTIPRGTAAVFAADKIVGVLNFGLSSEEGALRLDELKPRRAP